MLRCHAEVVGGRSALCSWNVSHDLLRGTQYGSSMLTIDLVSYHDGAWSRYVILRQRAAHNRMLSFTLCRWM